MRKDEASGRINGTVQIGGRHHEIDGLYHRDHSWGLRRWDTLRSHRWVAGAFGPDLAFGTDDNAATVLDADGKATDLGRRPKEELADAVWDLVRPLLP